MANLIIQENGVARTRPAVTGEEITIKTPCGCSDVTGVQINGVAFPFYDASGNSLADMTGLFAKDSLIRVLIDADKTRAYILNADTNAYLEGQLANRVKKSGDSMTGRLDVNLPSNKSAAFGGTRTVNGVTGAFEVGVMNINSSPFFSINYYEDGDAKSVVTIKNAGLEKFSNNQFYPYIDTSNSKGYVHPTYTATIPASWTKRTDGGIGYSQTLNIAGVKKTDDPIIAIAMTDSQTTNQTLMEAWNLVTHITTYDGTIILYCYEDAPTVAIPIKIQCMR